MDEEGFARFLKRGGRSPSAVGRCIRHARDFEAFLRDHREGKSIEEATNSDIETYVEWVEREPRASAKIPLWALRYYFQYASMDEQRVLATRLRQERIKRTPFPLKNFVDVDPEQVERLTAIGIKSVDEMLKAGRIPEERRRLSQESGIPPESVLEFVKLSDLARIRGIKGIRARLYHDAGIDTVEKMAEWDPEELRGMLVEWVERTGFEGIAPLLEEAKFSVESARKLPKIVEY
jgi:hypothetical protein